MDLLWNPKYKIVNNGIEENPELSKYIEEVYGDYFTESELDFFMRAFGTSSQCFAEFNGYKLSFKEVSIEQSEKILARHLAFRNYLRNNSEAVSEYEQLKKYLARKAIDRATYTEGKTKFVSKILERVMK